MIITPYLNFDGDCAQAFRFYEQLLGGTLESLMKFADTPMAGDVPPEWHDRVMHASLLLGDQRLMASDSPPGRHERAQGMYVSLHLESADEAERVFAAFAEGGEIRMPLDQTFWATRFGMVADRFGTPWMINCE
jgi:PhnB protein